jgi:hypothetical protein
MVTGGVLCGSWACPGGSQRIWGRGLFDWVYRWGQVVPGSLEQRNRIPNRIPNPEVEILESGNEILGPLMPNKGVCSETVLTRHGMTFFQAIARCCGTFRNRSTSVLYSRPFCSRETAKVRNKTAYSGIDF